MRDLGQDAATVAERWIRPHRAAMVEVDQNLQALCENVMRLAVLHVGHEADAAGILFQRGVVKTYRGRAPVMLANGLDRFRGRGRRQRIRLDVFALELRPAHLSPLNKAKGLTVVGAPWACAAPTGPPLVLREPQFQN